MTTSRRSSPLRASAPFVVPAPSLAQAADPALCSLPRAGFGDGLSESPPPPSAAPWILHPVHQASVGRPEPLFLKKLKTATWHLRHALAKFFAHIRHVFGTMTLLQQVFITALVLFFAALFALGLVYSHRIFILLRPVAESWRRLPAGWLVVFFLSVATAVPPLVGSSTVVAVSGFLYGFPGGWPVVAAANVVGSALSFVVCRTIFSSRVDRLVGGNHKFVALGQVLRRDGLGMLTLIRFCPLPYSLSNGFLAQVKGITPWKFALATGLSSPRLLIPIFIGSRLARLTDAGDSMSLTDKMLNYISMFAGGGIGLLGSWLVYQRTMKRAAELRTRHPFPASSPPGSDSGYDAPHGESVVDNPISHPEGMFSLADHPLPDRTGHDNKYTDDVCPGGIALEDSLPPTEPFRKPYLNDWRYSSTDPPKGQDDFMLPF